MQHFITMLFLFGLFGLFPTSKSTGINLESTPVGCIEEGDRCVPLDPEYFCVEDFDGNCVRVHRARPRKKHCHGPANVIVKIADPICDGIGYLKEHPCDVCEGCRVIYQTQSGYDRYGNPYCKRVRRRCPVCRGRGQLVCDSCRGFGTLWQCQPRH